MSLARLRLRFLTRLFLALLVTASSLSHATQGVDLPTSAQAFAETDAQGNLWLKVPTVPGKTYVVEGSNSVDADTYHPLVGGVYYGDGSVKSFFMKPAGVANGTPPPSFAEKPIVSSDWLITLAPSTQPGDNLTMLVTRVKAAPETSWTILTTQPIMRPFDQIGFMLPETYLDVEEPLVRHQMRLNFALSPTNLDLTDIPGPESLSGTDAEEWSLLDANKLSVMGFLLLTTGSESALSRPEGDAIFFRVRIEEGDLNANGLPDYWELEHGQNPYATGPGAADLESDADQDGLTLAQEYQLGTNPNLADTDGDGHKDGIEVAEGSNPLDPLSLPIVFKVALRSVISKLETSLDGLGQTGEYKESEFHASWPNNGEGGSIYFEPLHFPVEGLNAALDSAGDPVRFPFPETPENLHLATSYPSAVEGVISFATTSGSHLIGETGPKKSNTSNQSRLWLDAGRNVTEPVTRTFLKITRVNNLPEVSDVEVVPLTIPLGQQYSNSLTLTAETTSPAAGATTMKNETVVGLEIVNKDKKRTDTLRVAKMSEPGVLTSTGSTPETTVTVLDIDKDSDCFYVRIKGGATPGMGKHSIKIKTDNPDPTNYNNIETTVELHVDGNDLISPSLMLVSDKEDDEHKVDGIDFNNQVVPQIEDNQLHDRTFLVQLGGKLVVSQLVTTTKTIAPNLEAKVPIVKEMNVRVTVLRDKPEAVGGLPVILNDEIIADFKRINERYAQVGLKFSPLIQEPVDPPLFPYNSAMEKIDPPLPMNIVDGVQNIEIYHLLKSLVTSNTNDLELFYVTDIMTQYSPEGLANAHNFKGTFLISMEPTDRQYITTVPHELGHALGLKHVESEQPESNLINFKTNLLRDYGMKSNSINSLKRLTSEQQDKIRK